MIILIEWDFFESSSRRKFIQLLCLSGHNKKGANKNNEVKRPLWEWKNKFGARIKIMWEEQIDDPPIHYVIQIYSYGAILPRLNYWGKTKWKGKSPLRVIGWFV